MVGARQAPARENKKRQSCGDPPTPSSLSSNLHPIHSTMAGFAPPGAPPPGAGYYAAPPPVGYGSAPPMHHGGPPPPSSGPSSGGGFTIQDTVGSFEGVNYRIDHRDSNSILHLTLQQGYEVKARPGAMVTMQASVQIRGNFKLSIGKLLTGGEMGESSFTGPGEVVLAPGVWGDIVPIRVSLAQSPHLLLSPPIPD